MIPCDTLSILLLTFFRSPGVYILLLHVITFCLLSPIVYVLSCLWCSLLLAVQMEFFLPLLKVFAHRGLSVGVFSIASLPYSINSVGSNGIHVVMEYMYRLYVFKIQNMSYCIPLQLPF